MQPRRFRGQMLKRMCGRNPSGMDLASAVPLDTQALLAPAEQDAQSDAAEGWGKNLSTSALQTQLQLDLVHRRDGVQRRLLIQF